MIINKSFARKLYNAILKAKKISKLSFEEGEFINWCNTLNVIAELPYDVELLGRYELERYYLPRVFADLVVPRKISHAEGIKWKDIRSKDYTKYSDNLPKYDMVGTEVLVPLEFNEITAAILGAVKKDVNGNTQTITELNGEVTSVDYLEKFADLSKAKDKIMVATRSEQFIPVAVDSTNDLMQSKYYNQYLDVCLDSWIEEAINSLRSTK